MIREPRFRAGSSSACASPCAIAVDPEVILMDEPASALDPIATAKIEELIDELFRPLRHRHRHPLDAASRPRSASAQLSSTSARWWSMVRHPKSSPNPIEERTKDYITGRVRFNGRTYGQGIR